MPPRTLARITRCSTRRQARLAQLGLPAGSRAPRRWPHKRGGDARARPGGAKCAGPDPTCGCPRPRGRRTGRTRRPGAAPGRSCPATLSGLSTLVEVGERELPAGRLGPAAGAVPCSSSRCTRGLGGQCPAATRLSAPLTCHGSDVPECCSPESQHEEPRDRHAPLQLHLSRTTILSPAPGAAGGSHRPCRRRRRQRLGQPRVAARYRVRPAGYGHAQTSGSGRGEPRENLLRGDGAGRWGRVTSAPLRSPPPGDLPLPAWPPRRHSVGLSVRPSVPPSLPSRRRLLQEMALSGGHRALCSPSDITSWICMSRAPTAPEAANHRARRPRSAAPGRDRGSEPPGGRDRTGRGGAAAAAVGEVCGGGAPRGLLLRAAWFPERRERWPTSAGAARAPVIPLHPCGPSGASAQHPALQGRRAWGHHRDSAPPSRGSAWMSRAPPHAQAPSAASPSAGPLQLLASAPLSSPFGPLLRGCRSPHPGSWAVEEHRQGEEIHPCPSGRIGSALTIFPLAEK